MVETPYQLAQRFVGMAEVPGSASNPAVLSMLKLDGDWPSGDHVPWCSAFMNFIAWLMRLPRSKKLSARSWLDVGLPVELDQAVPGHDVVIFWRGSPNSPNGHVGFYAGVQGDDVLVLGGNQGDTVSISAYPKSKLLGVRRLV
jgi:uncharacterized protein (TIGR02594 family)